MKFENFSKFLGAGRRRFSQIPDYVFDHMDFATTTEFLIYLFLYRHSDQEGCSFPSMRYLSRKCRCSKTTVVKATKVLESKGYITICNSGNYKNNLYKIIPPDLSKASVDSSEEEDEVLTVPSEDLTVPFEGT